LSLKAEAIRLNIERGTEFVEEFRAAALAKGFSNFQITTNQPKSWADFMLEKIEENPTEWVMPWPGDHIYINPDDNAFIRALKKGEELSADSVLYGHHQDFEYFLDWDLIDIVYNDPEYLMIEWGQKYRYRQNGKLQSEAKKLLGQDLLMVPVPAFAVYKREIFKKILQALPPNTIRWQDMEYSSAAEAEKFKLLIPKQCLYRHVHGYWLEGFFKFYQKGKFPKDKKTEMQSWYIKTNYDWKSDSPNRAEYREACLRTWPYFKQYFTLSENGRMFSEFAFSPFLLNFTRSTGIVFNFNKFLKNQLIEPLKLSLSPVARKLRKFLPRILNIFTSRNN
jgi:hypothetical protein